MIHIPRDIVFFDVVVPTLLMVFLLAAGLSFLINWVISAYGLHRYVWYPSLFRLSVLMLFFSVLGLCVY